VYLCSLGGASVLLLLLDPVVHISVLCLLKLAVFIVVLFHYNSLIIVNHAEIFVCTDDLPLLEVYFFRSGITSTGIYSLTVHVIGA